MFDRFKVCSRFQKDIVSWAWREPSTAAVGIWGALIARRLLTPDHNDVHLLRFCAATMPKLGDMPLPICTAVSLQANDPTKKGGERYQWAEFTPFSVGFGSGQAMSLVDAASFRDVYSGGVKLVDRNDDRLHFMLGLWGSAFASPLQEYAGSLDDPIVKYLIQLIGPQRTLRELPASVPNWGYNDAGAADEKFPSLRLRDGGIDFNLPLPPLLRQDRAIDVIVVHDMSEDVVAKGTAVEDGRPSAFHSLIEAWCFAARNELPFPNLARDFVSAVTSPLSMTMEQQSALVEQWRAALSLETPFLVFAGAKASNTPTIVYIPLVQDPESTFQPVPCAARPDECDMPTMKTTISGVSDENVLNMATLSATLLRHSLGGIKRVIGERLQE
jgi:hypothetical protein